MGRRGRESVAGEDAEAASQEGRVDAAGTPRERTCFLNLPYERIYEPLCVAYVSALTAFGIVPKLASEVTGSSDRLSRIREMIRRAAYSIHDLSNIGRRRTQYGFVPRFNMPFELGLAVEAHAGSSHEWRVFESVPYRLQASLSDLNGFDPVIHGGTPDGVLRGLFQVLSRAGDEPDLPFVQRVYGELAAFYRKQRRLGMTIFEPACFRPTVQLGRELAAGWKGK